jgi:hypothetical protein
MMPEPRRVIGVRFIHAEDCLNDLFPGELS